MNKRTKWLLVLSLVTTITGSGIVMAAATSDQRQGDAAGSPPVCQRMEHGKRDNKALLALLKIDEATLHSEFKAGKTLSQIAAEHGVAEQAVIDLVQKQMIRHIDEGVKAGRLTAEQATQMKADAAQRAEQMVRSGPGLHEGHGPGMFGPHGMGHGMMDDKALLDLLKIDEATLHSEFKAGKTLSQIAAEQGVDEQAVIDLVQTQMIRHIDEGVKAGRLTEEQATRMKADAAQRAERMVKSGPGMFGRHMGRAQDHKELLDLLKIDETTLHSEFKAGKTLSQIAEEQGVPAQTVIDLVKQQMTKHIEEGFKAGCLTAEQAEQMKAGVAQKAEHMVNSAPKMKPQN